MGATGKILYDAVASRLAAQKDNQTALVGRAKDLFGSGSIVATIVGVLGNDKLVNLSKGAVPIWWAISMAAAFGVLASSGIIALLPREWSFAIDPADLRNAINDDMAGVVADDQWYRSIADGFLVTNPRKIGLLQRTDASVSQLDYNADQIRSLGHLVIAEAVALAAIVSLTFVLLAIVVI